MFEKVVHPRDHRVQIDVTHASRLVNLVRNEGLVCAQLDVLVDLLNIINIGYWAIIYGLNIFLRSKNIVIIFKP